MTDDLLTVSSRGALLRPGVAIARLWAEFTEAYAKFTGAYLREQAAVLGAFFGLYDEPVVRRGRSLRHVAEAAYRSALTALEAEFDETTLPHFRRYLDIVEQLKVLKFERAGYEVRCNGIPTAEAHLRELDGRIEALNSQLSALCAVLAAAVKAAD